jgi:hypothetical protein
MKILSWDIGIYNCSYILVEVIPNSNDEMSSGKFIINDWDIVNFLDDEKMKKNRTLLFQNIPKKLDEIPELLNADIVLIENQPSLKNPQMKSVQMILYSYFLIKGDNLKIEFISATNKLKILKNNDELNGMIDEIKLKTKNSYLQKKKISIAYCERLLNENDNYKNYLDFYKNNKKKDDLADSFLQCLYYVNNCL